MKEHSFQVFESVGKEEIKEFMNVLKHIDDSFEVTYYLDKKTCTIPAISEVMMTRRGLENLRRNPTTSLL